MKISLGWLNEFIDHGLDSTSLAEMLTMSGTEVNGIEEVGQEFEQIYVGQIIDIVPHPKADRLQLAMVEIAQKQPVQVVCGAPNIARGQKIVYAPIGSLLYMSSDAVERTALTSAVIRGVESNGMICSARELGVGNEHKSGVVILEDSCKVGEPLSTAQGMRDTILDLEVTPNRGDCLSIYGIARELSALTEQPLNKSESLQAESLAVWKEARSQHQTSFQVEIENDVACPHYSALIINDLQVTTSPLWMRWRLQNVGVRPINNMVDVTNYVMLELGEPQHAFDRDKLTGDKLIVRNAKKKETLTTLDSKARKLASDTLVIADTQSPVALAGIMGGENTEITAETSRVILEAAHFEPNQLRHVSTEQILRTEGSSRWEKYVDPNLRLWSLQRSAQLLLSSNADVQFESLIDITSQMPPLRRVSLSEQKIRQLLGQPFSLSQVKKWLTALGFTIMHEDQAEVDLWTINVEVPRFRPDVWESADLVEEVLRMAGLDKIGARIPVADFPLKTTKHQTDARRIALSIMKSLGYTEAFRYSMESDAFLNKLEIPNTVPIRLSNPLAEFESLRFSLIPGLLDTIQKNFQRESSTNVFALGRVFRPISDKELPDQPEFVSGMLVRTETEESSVWGADEQPLAMVKTQVNALLGALGLEEVSYILGQPDEAITSLLHPGRSAQIEISGQTIGWLAEIHPSILMKLGIEEVRAVGFELDFSALLSFEVLPRQFERFSAFPPIVVDLSLIMPSKTLVASLQETIKEMKVEDLVGVEVIDVFKSEELMEANQKGLTIRLTFQAEDRTLEDNEVQPRLQTILSSLSKQHGAVLRVVE